jgi:tetratricopeptide (TPR) repeat protein
LFEANLADGDTISAQNVLTEGIEKYDDNHDLILLLSDLLFQLSEVEQAVDLLDSAMVKYPGEHIFPYTQGLIYQKAGQYNDAIEAYKKANEVAPDDLMIYVNIATCYYNIGVDIEESARTLTLNRLVQQEKSRSAEAFENAVIWLDKAYDQEPEDEVVIQKLFQLYKSLRINDKMEIIEEQIN